MSSSTRRRSASTPTSLGVLEAAKSCSCIADEAGRSPSASSAGATPMTSTSSCRTTSRSSRA
eukprot:4280583-Lingulodinium_polyedra.AAC.1